MFFPIHVSAALPESLTNDYQNRISMKYSLSQTYESSKPSGDKSYLSILEYDIVFEENGDWDTELQFKAQYYDGTCEDDYSITYDFRYLVSNNTREISEVYQRPELDGDLSSTHPSYFCEKNIAEDQSFLINEIILLYDRYKEFKFKYNGTTNINLEGNSYEAVEFNLNDTIPPDYIVA
ncbi:MAG: hypothetical protein R6U96_12370 [Promethearchaeia archaeon]